MRRQDKNIDTITMDVPLFIRMLEFAKEDAKTDMDLHKATEAAIKLTKEFGTLSMYHYDEIITMPKDTKEPIKESMDLTITDESPDTITVLAKYNDRNAGIIMITTARNTENTLEIVGIRFKKEYESLLVINQAVNSIWGLFPEMNAIIVAPKHHAIEFWNKMGFSRISKNYLIANRGH